MRFQLLFLVIFLFACEKEPVNSIDQELLPYIESFQYEAQARGIDIGDLSRTISAELQTIVGDVVGQCNNQKDHPNQIFIDYQYWNTTSDLEREFLVFHELGHCVLNRAHYDAKDQEGICLSIMHSNGQACENDYRQDTRAAYLDELFSK